MTYVLCSVPCDGCTIILSFSLRIVLDEMVRAGDGGREGEAMEGKGREREREREGWW